MEELSVLVFVILDSNSTRHVTCASMVSPEDGPHERSNKRAGTREKRKDFGFIEN